MGAVYSLVWKSIRSYYLKGTDIENGNIRRLWAYNSTSGPGKYVQIIPPTSDQTCSVKATGRAEGTTQPYTNIKLYEVTALPLMFALQFQVGQDWYTVTASNNSVVAATNITPAQATSFNVIELWFPNEPYCVLQSNQMQGGDKLYLSSDGTGHLKLKTWNKPIADPPEASAEVDPALLFRVVRPFGEQ